ncbi:MAG: hypothetical protein U0163_17200 [Gemmatimonadaceae bacterium]
MTPHYENYTSVLTRVWELTDAELRELLRVGYAFVTATETKAKRRR